MGAKQAIAAANYPIENRRYLIRIKTIDQASSVEIKQFGLRSSGNRRTDGVIREMTMDRYCGIFGMLDFFVKGIPFSLCNPADSKEIFELIVDYLSAWKNYLSTSFNPLKSPVEGLIQLDLMAGRLYGHATQFMSHEPNESPLMRTLGGDGMNYDSLLKSMSEGLDRMRIEEMTGHGVSPVQINTQFALQADRLTQNKPMREYESSAEFFAQHYRG